MNSKPCPSVPKELLNCASELNSDKELSLRVPPLTIAFLHRLRRQCDDYAKPLCRFLIPISRWKLKEAIIKVALPSEYANIRDEVERLQTKKEEALVCQEWQRAVAMRDKQNLLRISLREMPTIEVQPAHIIQALSALGYTEPIAD